MDNELDMLIDKVSELNLCIENNKVSVMKIQITLSQVINELDRISNDLKKNYYKQ